MPELVVVMRNGTEKRLEAQNGLNVMEAMRDGGVDEVLALCGGCCSCATCHVYVDTKHLQQLPQMSNDESDLLDGSAHRKENSRLSCQIKLSDHLSGLRVTVAPED